MIGRLIVAILIICSAGAVMWQRQEAEAADVSATLSEDKVAEANKKVVALEEKLAESEARAAQVEARNKYLEGELQQLASDCTPVSDDDGEVSIASFKFRGVKGKTASFALVLGGDAAEIVRLRVTASPAWDPARRMFVWDTSAGDAWRAVVTRNGKAVTLDSEHSYKKAQGPLHMNVALSDNGGFVHGAIFEVEVILKSGARVTARNVISN